LNPSVATLFIQSKVPSTRSCTCCCHDHDRSAGSSGSRRTRTAEQLKEKDLATYGFLGYPLLQSADILLYRPMYIPVGEDQVAHVEITREIARRFNFIYGRSPTSRPGPSAAVKNLGARTRPSIAICAGATRSEARPSR